MKERIITGELRKEDLEIEAGIRPKTFDDYIGQEKVKNNLQVFIKAAKIEKKAWTMSYFMVLLVWEKRP